MESKDVIPTKEDIVRLVHDHEVYVDEKCLQLYPATNRMSPTVRSLLSSTIGSRPAEGEPGERYQTGMAYIDDLDRLANSLLRELYGASGSEIRVLSGSMANALVFNALKRPQDF